MIPNLQTQLCILLLLLVQFRLKAQTGSVGVVFQCTQQEITSANQELANLLVKVHNQSTKPLRAHIEVNLSKDLDLISKNSIELSLMPGDSIFVPIKLFVSPKAQSGKKYPIIFSLIDHEHRRISTTTSSLSVLIKKSVAMFALVSNILLDQNTDTIRIPVRVSNQGNTAQKISVISRYPSVVEGGDFYTSAQFILAASSDTLIYFAKPIQKRMFTQEGFDVNITGLYANGELFSMAYVRVQNALNNRFYRDQSFNDSYNDNSITLSSQSIFTPNEAYLLTGRGRVELPQGNVGYNLDMTTYKNSSYSPMMVRNTFIGYEAFNIGIKAGNINRNLDINLSGRGGMFFVTDTATKNQYEGGYIRSNTNLFGEGYGSVFQSGKAGWAMFTHTAKKWQLSSSAIYEFNPLMSSRNALLSNEITWINARQLRFSFILNAGHTALNENGAHAKYSFATGITVSGSVDKLIINSMNYISSGYYPGSRRGALNFSERLTWTRPSGNLWAAMDYYQYKPRYFIKTFFLQQDFSSLRAELGISEKLFNQASLSISPYYTMERNNSFLLIQSADQNPFLRSWNIISTLNFPLSAQQYLSMNVDGGFYKSSMDLQAKFHLRSSLNYRYGFFNFMASAQTGMFYMGEILNSFIRNLGSNYIINITPSIQKSFVRNKLRTELGVSYGNTRVSGKSWQLTGRTEYEMFAKTSVFAALNHNRYSFINGQYHTSILELGITKKMQSARVGAKNAPLEVFVFKDFNQNGIFDQGDSVAVNCLVYINDVVFITRPDGTVVYKNLPAGRYRITLPKTKGWYTPDQQIEFDKKKRVEIPLQKTGTLRGQISYISNQFSYEVPAQKDGIEVTATSENRQTYVTRTDAKGQYVFFMPIGKYSITINKGSLPAEVQCENEGQATEVVSGQINSVDLILKVKQRKIEVKKFTSASLGKNKE